MGLLIQTNTQTLCSMVIYSSDFLEFSVKQVMTQFMYMMGCLFSSSKKVLAHTQRLKSHTQRVVSKDHPRLGEMVSSFVANKEPRFTPQQPLENTLITTYYTPTMCIHYLNCLKTSYCPQAVTSLSNIKTLFKKLYFNLSGHIISNLIVQKLDRIDQCRPFCNTVKWRPKDAILGRSKCGFQVCVFSLKTQQRSYCFSCFKYCFNCLLFFIKIKPFDFILI